MRTARPNTPKQQEQSIAFLATDLLQAALSYPLTLTVYIWSAEPAKWPDLGLPSRSTDSGRHQVNSMGQTCHSGAVN